MESKSDILYKVTPKNLKEYEKYAVFFSKPCLVAFFEYYYEKLTPAKRIKYLQMPKSCQYPIDLNVGFETYIRRNQSMYSEQIQLSLRYDMFSAVISECHADIEKTKVITRRGTVVHLMEMYYSKHDIKGTLVSRFNNNLYMVKEEDNELSIELKPVHSHHLQLDKFLFADSPDATPKIHVPSDENIKLIGVHRSNFGKYDFIYSGEIQGVMEDDKISNFDDLDELTDRRFVLSKQMWKTLKNKDEKYLNYWLQSYLANVKDIFIGYKTETGLIEEPIEHLLVKELPKNRTWKPHICTGFLYNFLENVEKIMSSVNSLTTVYVFTYSQKNKCFTYKIFEGKTEKSFITEEYQEFCRKHYNF